MKIYLSIRMCLFTVLAVLVLVFLERIVNVLQYFIGSLMIFYGLEEIVYAAVKEKKHFSVHSLYWNALEILLGITLLAFLKNEEAISYTVVCVVWATWSLLREARELIECTENFKTDKTAIPDILESLVVIGFSIALVIHPTQSHASMHLYLLFAELLTKALFALPEYIKLFKAKAPATPIAEDAPAQAAEESAVTDIQSENDEQ